jgi:aminomethyltransferase
MKQTALFSVLSKQSVKMTEFQGWSVPLQFSDPAEEHHAVRTTAGLFDVGFLGRTEVSGTGAERLLQSLFSRDVSAIPEGMARFGLFCDEYGSIIDAALLFRLPAGRESKKFLVTTTPIATETVSAWIARHAGSDVQISDRTAETGQLALQGPRAMDILAHMAGTSFKKIKDHRLKDMKIAGLTVMVSRTGYTGERGYELFAPADSMTALWDAVIAIGGGFGLLPCGMTCRDILRIEVGLVQNGTDLDGKRTPVEARLMSVVEFSADFIGRSAISKIRDEGARDQLIGFELFDKGIPRPGSAIFSESREIGFTTSGNHSPHRRRDIGLGYVLKRYAQPSLEIEVEIKDREIAARIVELPFYRRKS